MTGIELDKWLGKRVIIDGREWEISSISGGRAGDTVRLLWRDRHIDCPLFVLLGALDYGLLQEV